MRALLITCMLSCALMGYGQQEVKGKVIGRDDNQPLLGAHVILLSNFNVSTVTGQDGSFVLDFQPEPGDSLLISFVGYEDLLVATGQFLEQSVVYMSPSDREMNVVVVSAERLIAEEFSTQKISRIEVYKNPSSKADPILAVNSLPSATTADESANISFRGGGPGETGVFLNGVPVYDFVRFSQLDGIGTLSVFNTALLRNVQVFPGNPPLEFGNVSSGLIAMETDDALPQASEKSLAVSLANVGGSLKAPVGKSQGIFAYFNYQPSVAFKAFNEESLEDILSFNSVDAGIHYVNELSEKWRMKIFNYSQLESYDFAYQSPTFSGVFEQRKVRNLVIGNLTHQGRVSQWRLNGGANVSRLGFNYSLAEINVASQDYFLGLTHQFELGKWGMKSGISYDKRRSDFDGVLAVHDFAERPTDPFSTSDALTTRQIAESFFYLKYDLTEKLVGGAAIRRSLPFLNERRYWARQVNLSYELAEFWKLNAAYGTFYGQYLSRSSDSDAVQFTETEQASIDVFYKRRQLDFTLSVFQKWISRSQQDEDIQGIEIAHGYAKGGFKYNLSYTFINANQQNDEIQFPGNFDFNYFVKAGVEWMFLPNWSAGVRALFREGTFFYPVLDAAYRPDLDAFEPRYAPLDEGQRLPGYNIVDLNLSKLIPASEKLTIIAFLGVGNAFDFRNRRAFSYNFDYSVATPELFSRRTVYFGAVINFI